jgi:penicillin-binding protein 2
MDRSSSRLKILALLVALMFIALSTRLWYLQVLATTRFVSAADIQTVRTVETDALRGNILDDSGRVLVDNRPSLEVRVSQDHIGNQADAVLLRLSRLLKIPVKAIRNRLADKRYYTYQPIPVAEFVSKKIAFYVGEHQDRFPGVEVVQTSVRHYPEGSIAAHALGWVGQISASELRDQKKFAGYGTSDLVGKAGLESVYERYLRGQNGVDRFLVNSAGLNLRSLGSVAPTAGDSLVLALDTKIPRIAEQ